MHYAALLYDPIYESFGVSATLTPDGPEAAPIGISVIERTTSADGSEEFELGTLRPSTFVRRRELDQAGIAPAELDGGTLLFGGGAGGSMRMRRAPAQPASPRARSCCT